MIWNILGIEETKDEEMIKAAYRKRLPYVNPEDDEEGFKELREAYEAALRYATESEEDLQDIEEAEQKGKKKTDIDLWIDRIDRIYSDVRSRRDGEKWNRILHDPVCDDLDTELEAAEKLLVYLMSHTYLPQNIWQLMDERFSYRENMKQLKEQFPENFLEYVKWQIEHQGFIDYEMFDGKTDDRPDEFINKIYEVQSAFEEGDMQAAKRLLRELDRFSIEHPFTKAEWARYLMEADGDKDFARALEIMEELDFEFSQNPYIERIYAEALVNNKEYDKALQVYETLIAASAENYSAMLGKAKCIFLQGNPEDAKELVEDVLEDRVQDSESLRLLDELNEVLIRQYEERLKQQDDREVVFKLGWCYYQKKEFEKGIELLDGIEEAEDYDYINLRCRLYLAAEDYEKAFPLAKKWTAQIEESVDDGSHEMKKRKNRLSLAHFSVGICLWELTFKQSEKEKNREFEEADTYIRKAIGEETNQLVKLSYMEQLARFYLGEKRYEECIGICDEIVEQDKGFYPAYVHRQKANYELKNAKEVIDDYYICREIYPGYSRPYVLAAEVFMAFDQYDDVEQIIEAGIEAELDSDSLELFRIKCLHYKEFSKEHVQEALEAIFALKEKISKRSEEEPTDIEDMADVERELAIIYWDQDKNEAAINVVNTFLEENPDTVTMLQLKADILMREEQYKEALALCKKVVQLEPDSLFNRTRVGNCYERMDETEKAIQCYRAILALNEDYVPAVRRLMYIYSYLSNHEDDLAKCRTAISYATKLIELTGTAEGYVERGNLYIDIYELEKSVADCKEAIQLDEDAYYAYNNLGCALLKLRRVNEAVEPLKHVIAAWPSKDRMPYLNLAECYVLMQDYGKAIETYESLLKIWPDHVSILEEIAKVRRKQGTYSKAIAIYKQIPEEYLRVYQKNKKDDRYRRNLVESYCNIGDTYRQAGDMKNAEHYFKRAVKDFFSIRRYLSPTLLDSAIEFYRDRGENKKAEKICRRLLKWARANKEPVTRIAFMSATVFFEMGKSSEAAKYASLFLQNYLESKGGEEALLDEARYRPMRLYDMGIMCICAGQYEKAKKYLGRIPECNLCASCETSGCFEYYFGMGLIAELEGRKEEAKMFYEKAIAIKGDYSCCENHLNKL